MGAADAEKRLAIAKGIAMERERVLGLIQHGREEGETDLRQLRNWVESGLCAETMEGSD